MLEKKTRTELVIGVICSLRLAFRCLKKITSQHVQCYDNQKARNFGSFEYIKHIVQLLQRALRELFDLPTPLVSLILLTEDSRGSYPRHSDLFSSGLPRPCLSVSERTAVGSNITRMELCVSEYGRLGPSSIILVPQ